MINDLLSKLNLQKVFYLLTLAESLALKVRQLRHLFSPDPETPHDLPINLFFLHYHMQTEFDMSRHLDIFGLVVIITSAIFNPVESDRLLQDKQCFTTFGAVVRALTLLNNNAANLWLVRRIKYNVNIFKSLNPILYLIKSRQVVRHRCVPPGMVVEAEVPVEDRAETVCQKIKGRR